MKKKDFRIELFMYSNQIKANFKNELRIMIDNTKCS